jgi:hypothetical protein
VKGDARPERQSSWRSARLQAWRGRGRNYVRITFAGFVLIHFLVQAFRAGTSGALPGPGLEAAPELVAVVLLAVWLPFLFFAAAELMGLGRAGEDGSPSAAPEAQQRALEKIEPLSLLVVLAFALLHGAHFAWPLLSGHLLIEDVRPELIAVLSSTRRGVPLQATAALCGVGAASFYAVRQLQKAFSVARPVLARGLLVLGLCSYLLGSYAVIRCASGSLLP